MIVDLDWGNICELSAFSGKSVYSPISTAIPCLLLTYNLLSLFYPFVIWFLYFFITFVRHLYYCLQLQPPFMVYSWCSVAELCRSSAAIAAFVNPYIPSFLASPSLVPSISLASPLLCKRACSRSKMKIHFTFYSLNRSLINKLPEIRPSGSKTVWHSAYRSGAESHRSSGLTILPSTLLGINFLHQRHRLSKPPFSFLTNREVAFHVGKLLLS